MINTNLATLRKAKKISQEELAIRLNVVRQTVSKWEKGYSVPDADMLIKIADALDVSVADLLGDVSIAAEADNGGIAEQLSRINEQLAIKNRRARRVWKVIVCAIVLVAIICVGLLIRHHILFGDEKPGTIAPETEISQTYDEPTT